MSLCTNIELGHQHGVDSKDTTYSHSINLRDERHYYSGLLLVSADSLLDTYELLEEAACRCMRYHGEVGQELSKLVSESRRCVNRMIISVNRYLEGVREYSIPGEDCV